jgi:hypothetical protein
MECVFVSGSVGSGVFFEERPYIWRLFCVSDSAAAGNFIRNAPTKIKAWKKAAVKIHFLIFFLVSFFITTFSDFRTPEKKYKKYNLI